MTKSPSRADVRFALRRLMTMHFNADGSPVLSFADVEEIAHAVNLPIREVTGTTISIRTSARGA